MLTMRYIKKEKFDSILREILVKEPTERYYVCNNERHRCGAKFSTKQSFRYHIESNCFTFHCNICNSTINRYDNYLRHINKH
jgi:transcription initiation factor IIE alpha subunit